MNDSNSDLVEAQIERERNRVFGRGYNRSDSGNSKSFRTIIEGVVILAIAGLGAEVWLLKGTADVQQASIQFLQKQIDSVASESRDNSHKVDEMQGRFYRGLQQGKDIYAPDQQR